MSAPVRFLKLFLPAGLVFLAPNAHAWAQADGDPVTLGVYRIMESEILGEDRVLQVHLPTGYEGSDLSYPVVYLFYSDWEAGYFAQTVNDLYHLTIDRMPQVILVGIPNVQRYRDLYPWPLESRPEAGGAGRFLQALKEEIIPFIEEEFRTKPYRIMIGPQAAAVFGVYTLLEEPGTFQAFILNDPCRLDSTERSLCKEIVDFASSPESGRVFLAVSHHAGDTRWPGEFLAGLRSGLAARASDGFRWRVDLVPDWPFFLAPVMVREALLDLFARYPFPESHRARNLADILAHYERVSSDLGFKMEPPNLVLVQVAATLREGGAYPEAMEVLNHLVELHPSSLDGPWQLANLHRVMGDTAAAIRYYEECLRRDPEMAAASQWLDRLRGNHP